MFGQGRPKIWFDLKDRVVVACAGFCCARLGIGALVLVCYWTQLSVFCDAAEITVRLRIAWGDNAQVKQRWVGKILVAGGTLSDLQPLGVEADASVAMYLDGNRLVVDPLEKRGFDGCDVTVRADEEAMVRFELRKKQANQAVVGDVVEVTLKQLAAQQLHQQLGGQDGFLIARRSPGDRLRVKLSRDHLVFQPNEAWKLGVQPDFVQELAEGPVQLEVRMHRTGDSNVLWQAGRQIDVATPESDTPEFEIICPDQEGAYRLTISARHLEGLATRFVPGRQAKLLASREVEFVVVDPLAKLPALTDNWEPVLSIEPSNPRWWQRLPSWAKVSRIGGGKRGALGNTRPVLRKGPSGDLVELPPAPSNGEPYWQSYTLPVREIGRPHVVELQYPLAMEQYLAISVIEPDAAGRVTSNYRDAGFTTQGIASGVEGELGTHRFVFWPRTESPQLLIVNRHPTKPAQYGKINLLRHAVEAVAPPEVVASQGEERLVACYLSQPVFADCLGAAESFDEGSGLSVQTWATFLDGANRLAQHLRYQGYNSVVLAVAGDGSSLYPSELLKPSPRYDTGLLATSGQDPVKKDVLELLLRVFDREGLRVVPQLQLATPLPRLEQLHRKTVAQTEGFSLVGAGGSEWLAGNAAVEGRAPHYNVLNERVQDELSRIVAELSERYSSHAAFAGVGLKVSGEGYGLLPGLGWGIDDATVISFSRDTGVEVPLEGPRMFRRRTEQLLGPGRQQWQAWRVERLTQMYARMATELTTQRSDLKLVLATEDVFAGAELQQRVRKAISRPVKLNQVLLEHGLDLAGLDRVPGIVALSASRLNASDQFQQRALGMRINTAAELGELYSIDQQPALLLHHTAEQLRLTSYDTRGSLGAERTQLTLACQPMIADLEQRRRLASALAKSDAEMVVVGGEFLTLASNPESRSILESLQQLPALESEVHSQSVQPVVVRTLRTADSTVLMLINESPWSTQVQLPVSSTVRSEWQKLGRTGALPTAASSAGEQAGTLAVADRQWLVELAPYGLQAWEFDTTELRFGRPQVSLDSLAGHDLQQRIDEIESRTGNLNIRRLYAELVNPDFELDEGGEVIVGWQSQQGRVEVVSSGAYSGAHALRIQSQKSGGAAIKSNLFTMPATGQLMVSGQIRGVNVSPEARLYIVFEDVDNGRTYQRYAVLGGENGIDSEWSKFEFPVDDIPFDTDGQMRVKFHLMGQAEVLLDDLELHDLRFDKLQRGALVKGVYAAKTALDEGQVIDCLRLVDQYWSQYLIEFVPPVESRVLLQAKQPARPKVAKVEEEAPGFTDRLKGWVPKIWR